MSKVRRTRPILCILVSTAILSLISGTHAADQDFDWPGFRGPNVDGISSETGVFKGEGVQLELAWKKPIGNGYSSVAIADGEAITAFSDGKYDVVAAFNTTDGREIWRYTLDEIYKGHDGSKDGPLSTPLIADGRVFMLAPRGRLVAFDAGNGKEIWKTDLVKDHGAVAPHYGFSTSPLYAANVLIVEIGAKKAPFAGFDPTTGKRLWTAGDDKVNYESPIPYTQAGRSLVLAAGDDKLTCLDPKTGDTVWSVPHKGGGGDRGAECLTPVPLGSNRLFLKHKDERSCVVEISGQDGQSTLTQVWEDRCIGKTYAVPVIYNDLIYGYNGLTLACVDAKTGKVAWRSRDPGDGFPMIVDNHLIIAAKAGGVYVAKTGSDEYHQLAGLKVFDDLIWAPPSFSRGAIYVRGMNGIARINIRPGPAPTIAHHEPDRDIAGTKLAKLLDGGFDAASDKSARIDKFMASIDSFPITEPDGRVIFIYRGPAKQVVLGGDLTGYGSKLPLKNVPGTDLFYAVTRLDPDTRIGYAFIADFKVITDPLNPRKVSVTGFDEDLEMSFTPAKTEMSWMAMPGWKPPTCFESVSESRRGKFESHKFKSAALNADVDVDVYIPADHKPDQPLPVVYIHSGKMAREDLHVPDALDNLIGSKITPVIAVFIKQRAPVFHAKPDEYAKMAGEELPKFIDEKYKTIRSREGRAHMASGMGSFAAMYTAFSFPDIASKVGIQSPFMVNVEPIEPVMKDASKSPMTIYLDWGQYDARSNSEGWSLTKAGRELTQYLRDHGYKPAGGEAHDGQGVESYKNRIATMLETLYPLK